MYFEGLINIVKKGRDGAEEIQNMMKNFRENPPKSLAGSLVEEVKDFKEQTNFVVSENKKTRNGRYSKIQCFDLLHTRRNKSLRKTFRNRAEN